MRSSFRLPTHEESVADHAELTRMLEAFGQLEADSLTQARGSDGQHLCFRLDGIKVSKHILKDQLVHPQFRETLARAIVGTYHLFKHQSDRQNKNFFLCVLALSDEVSFILNNRINYYENRTFKIGTMLAGTLSGYTSLYHQHSVSGHARKSKSPHEEFRPKVVAFDARPLLLDSYSRVEEYIRFRQLIGIRNAMCKVLRLRQVFTDRELYDTPLKNDVPRLTEAIAANRLDHDVQQVLGEFRLFIPDPEGKLHEHALPSPRASAPTLQSLRGFHDWLSRPGPANE